MADYWFKPKTYGYGATPSTWQGWAVTALTPFLVLSFTWPLMVAPALARTGPATEDVILWLAALAAFTIGFSLFVHAKTEGGWAWRWGRED